MQWVSFHMCKINKKFLLVPHCLLPDTKPGEYVLPESEYFTQHAPSSHATHVQKSPPAVEAQTSAQASEVSVTPPKVMSLP